MFIDSPYRYNHVMKLSSRFILRNRSLFTLMSPSDIVLLYGGKQRKVSEVPLTSSYYRSTKLRQHKPITATMGPDRREANVSSAFCERRDVLSVFPSDMHEPF